MKNFKKALKLFALISLIVLASLGIGIAGGIPLPLTNKKRQGPDINIELVLSADEGTEVNESEILL